MVRSYRVIRTRRLLRPLGAAGLVVAAAAGGVLAAGVLHHPAAAEPARAVGAGSAAGTVTPGFSGEQTYVPLEADCRAIDTRTSASLRLQPGKQRTFDLTGKCSIPSGAAAVEATVTSINASGTGTISIYPLFKYLGGVPTTPSKTFMNIVKGINLSSSGALPLPYPRYQDVLNSGIHPSLTLQALSASTDVVVDIRGFFQPPAYIQVDSSGNATYAPELAGSGLASSDRTATGVYVVQFVRNGAPCVYTATVDSTSGTNPASGPGFASVGRSADGKGAEVRTFDVHGNAADRGFFLTMTC